tara:strand:- start:2604 stop:2801 length:198 start_codon:yes stop_codon:yes gene_type:complete
LKELPWNEWMEIALGKIRLDPDVFWNMSFSEFYATLVGFQEFHSGSQPSPLSRAEMEDLMERFPD